MSENAIKQRKQHSNPVYSAGHLWHAYCSQVSQVALSIKVLLYHLSSIAHNAQHSIVYHQDGRSPWWLHTK